MQCGADAVMSDVVSMVVHSSDWIQGVKHVISVYNVTQQVQIECRIRWANHIDHQARCRSILYGSKFAAEVTPLNMR